MEIEELLGYPILAEVLLRDGSSLCGLLSTPVNGAGYVREYYGNGTIE